MLRKQRVYELGRHYGVDSKQIMILLQKMKVEAKSHMSVVEDADVDRIHSVFQRKRELARASYARDHGLDPDKLKHVAALKPLTKPVAQEEPEKKKKVTKKKGTKKKTKSAKPKVVVIKKAGTMTKVAKEAESKRQKKEKARAEEEAKRLVVQEKQQVEL